MSKLRNLIFKNLELDKKDWIVIVFSFLVFSFSALLFIFLEIQIHESSREVVGTVIYRNRVAQRRNSSSSIWSDVAQKEQVRNFDSIRTDELAEAIITLNSGTRIELDPFSMIVLNIIDEATEIQLLRGSILVDPIENDNIKIKKGEDTTIYFKQLIRIFGDESDFIQIFSNGKIEILNSIERKIYLEQHLIEMDSKISNDRGISLGTISPTDNSRYFVNSSQSLSITFLWKNESSESHEFILSSDPFFREVIFRKNTNDDFLKLALYDGNYYWKIKSAKSESLTKRFKIKALESISSISPAEKEEISLFKGELVAFSWELSELASDYKILITKDQQRNEVFLTKSSQRNAISISLPSGSYSWKVEGNGSLPGSNTSSEWKKFSVSILDDANLKINQNQNTIPKTETNINTEKIPKLDTNLNADPKNQTALLVPKAIYPLSVVDMAKKDKLVFRWQKVPSAQNYELILRNGSSNGKEVFRKTINTNQYVLTDLTILDVGNFSWEVKVYSETGDSMSSGNINFKIILSNELEAPVIE
ncbi:MAG: FecR family protein [Leptospiraceae bacterium]|nr:FecR family protein [Leptospiraceae bacterium]